jgi:hypothetical protein
VALGGGKGGLPAEKMQLAGSRDGGWYTLSRAGEPKADIPAKDDCPVMSGYDSLARRLCQVSPYAGRIEPIIDLIPEIMERNDQLRPLWTAWRQNATPDLTPRQYFTGCEIKVLCDFVEYLYFASDAFARSARTRR